MDIVQILFFIGLAVVFGLAEAKKKKKAPGARRPPGGQILGQPPRQPAPGAGPHSPAPPQRPTSLAQDLEALFGKPPQAPKPQPPPPPEPPPLRPEAVPAPAKRHSIGGRATGVSRELEPTLQSGVADHVQWDIEERVQKDIVDHSAELGRLDSIIDDPYDDQVELDDAWKEQTKSIQRMVLDISPMSMRQAIIMAEVLRRPGDDMTLGRAF